MSRKLGHAAKSVAMVGMALSWVTGCAGGPQSIGCEDGAQAIGLRCENPDSAALCGLELLPDAQVINRSGETPSIGVAVGDRDGDLINGVQIPFSARTKGCPAGRLSLFIDGIPTASVVISGDGEYALASVSVMGESLRAQAVLMIGEKVFAADERTYPVDLSAPELADVFPADGALLGVLHDADGDLDDGLQTTLMVTPNDALPSGTQVAAVVRAAGVVVEEVEMTIVEDGSTQVDLALDMPLHDTLEVAVRIREVSGNVHEEKLTWRIRAEGLQVAITQPAPLARLTASAPHCVGGGIRHDVHLDVFAPSRALVRSELRLGTAAPGSVVWRAPSVLESTGEGLIKFIFPCVSLNEGDVILEATARVDGLGAVHARRRLVVESERLRCDILYPADGQSLGPQFVHTAGAALVPVIVASDVDASEVVLSIKHELGTIQRSALVEGAVASFADVPLLIGGAHESFELSAECRRGDRQSQSLPNRVSVDLERPVVSFVHPIAGAHISAACEDAAPLEEGFQVMVEIEAHDVTTGAAVGVRSLAMIQAVCDETEAVQTRWAEQGATGLHLRAPFTLREDERCVFSARVMDEAGNLSHVTIVETVIDRAAPEVAIELPTPGGTVTAAHDASSACGVQLDVSVTLHNEDAAVLELFVTNELGAQGGWMMRPAGNKDYLGATVVFPKVTITPAAQDVVSLTLVATDTAGNATVASRVVYVEAPSIESCD